jgi:hypothetical protein
LQFKTSWVNKSARHYLEKSHHKNRADVMAQGIGPELKPQHCRKEKRKRLKYVYNL